MTKDYCGIEHDKNPEGVKATDKFARRINYLRVSVTDRCNLRCFYCMPENGICQLNHKQILRYEELLRVIRISSENGIDKVRITGGEPLVRKGIIDFIKDVAKIKAINDLTLTTNGIMLADMAKDIFDAGLKRLNISIDSLKERTYSKITRSGYLKKVLAGLQKAYEVGFHPIKINVVVIRGLNDDEVTDFAKMTQERPYCVRFIEYMPIGDKNNWDKKLFVPSLEIRSKINRYKQLEPVTKTDKSSPSSDYKFAGAPGTVGFISPLSKHFCLMCNRLRLTADGKLRSCLFSENEVDIKDALRSGKDDEHISKIILDSISGKPEGHEKLSESANKKRSMYSIGG